MRILTQEIEIFINNTVYIIDSFSLYFHSMCTFSILLYLHFLDSDSHTARSSSSISAEPIRMYMYSSEIKQFST